MKSIIEIQAMSAAEKDREIAGLVNWKQPMPMTDFMDRAFPQPPPRYSSSLEAMHEAEKIIVDAPITLPNDMCRKRYRMALRQVTGRLSLWHITADQRATVFIFTAQKP